MIESYLLILISIIMVVSHFFLFKNLLDEDFDRSFNVYQARLRMSMVEQNQNFVNTMKPIIELDPEASEIIGFGEHWRQRLLSIDTVQNKILRLQEDLSIVYFILIGTVIISSVGISNPNPILGVGQIQLYFTSLAWWTLFFALITMVRLLYRFQQISNIINEGKVTDNEDSKPENKYIKMLKGWFEGTIRRKEY